MSDKPQMNGGTVDFTSPQTFQITISAPGPNKAPTITWSGWGIGDVALLLDICRDDLKNEIRKSLVMPEPLTPAEHLPIQ